jgi:site-specific recombinase XerD
MVARLVALTELNMPGGIYSAPFFAVYGMRKNHHSNIGNSIDEFILAKQVEGKTPATLAFYRQNLERYLWWRKSQRLSQDLESVTTNELRLFLAYVQTQKSRWGAESNSSRKPASMATVDAYWRALQSLLAWLVTEGTISKDLNPLSKIPRPKVPVKVIEDIPLSLILKAMASWDPNTFLGARNQAILMILLDTGIRL